MFAEFRDGKSVIMVATDVASRGLGERSFVCYIMLHRHFRIMAVCVLVIVELVLGKLNSLIRTCTVVIRCRIPSFV